MKFQLGNSFKTNINPNTLFELPTSGSSSTAVITQGITSNFNDATPSQTNTSLTPTLVCHTSVETPMIVSFVNRKPTITLFTAATMHTIFDNHKKEIDNTTTMTNTTSYSVHIIRPYLTSLVPKIILVLLIVILIQITETNWK